MYTDYSLLALIAIKRHPSFAKAKPNKFTYETTKMKNINTHLVTLSRLIAQGLITAYKQ